MSLPAIEISGVSKRYVIQHEARHDSLRDTLHHTVRRLWRRYRWGTRFDSEDFWALRDASFSVERGEVIGIIGRNGAGKSTLLKILSRITEPTTGKITLRGRVASLLEVGTGFHPDLTGRENVYLNGAILGMSRAEIRAKFDEIVAFAEVERFLDTPVKRYSSGMYVRLAFAVAAHLDPEILIVDEVLAVGDQRFQEKCLGKIRNVARTAGRTVLFVSHNLKSVEQLCHRVVHLEAGRVRGVGLATEMVAEYIRGDRADVAETGPLDLSPKLRLEKFRLPTPACAGRGRLPFELHFTALETHSIQEIFLLIHNLQGERIGLLDLRRPGGARRLEKGQQLRLTGEIAPVMLTDGDYHLGLFLHADNIQEEHGALLRIIVRPAPSTEELPHILTQRLGATLIDGQFREEVIPSA